MKKHFTNDLEVERVARGLIDRTLPKLEWTHAAHFAAALWLLRHHSEPAVEAQMPPLIRAYNESTGVQNTASAGYHETITLASIAASRSFLARQPVDRPLHEIVDSLMASPLGQPDWLLAHWSKARLFSPAARLEWTDPDLAPLPKPSERRSE